MKILVVDDSLLLRKVIGNELASKGYEIIEAKEGSEAIEKYNTFHPDLITMDVTMDGMNGLEATKKILEEDPKAKIIMITALGDDEVMSQAVKLGVKDFIVKPFEPSRLINAIKKVLSKSKAPEHSQTG